MAGSPRIIARPTTRSPAACRRARVRQGQAFGGAEEAPSLTAAAPRRRCKYAVGTEECSRRGSNKRMECKGRPDWRDAPLTKKAPYKPDAGSRRADFGGCRLCDFQHQSGAVLDRAAVSVGTLVGAVLGELIEQIAVGAVDLDAVETGFDRVHRTALEALDDAGDFLKRQRAGLGDIGE